jgi:hypothetical protein
LIFKLNFIEIVNFLVQSAFKLTLMLMQLRKHFQLSWDSMNLLATIEDEDPSVSSMPLLSQSKAKCPIAVRSVVKTLCSLFAIISLDINSNWGEEALGWADSARLELAVMSIEVYSGILQPSDKVIIFFPSFSLFK